MVYYWKSLKESWGRLFLKEYEIILRAADGSLLLKEFEKILGALGVFLKKNVKEYWGFWSPFFKKCERIMTAANGLLLKEFQTTIGAPGVSLNKCERLGSRWSLFFKECWEPLMSLKKNLKKSWGSLESFF